MITEIHKEGCDCVKCISGCTKPIEKITEFEMKMVLLKKIKNLSNVKIVNRNLFKEKFDNNG